MPLANAEEIVVAVASNFSTTAKAISQRFEEATGHSVILALGSTGHQYAQIVHGAPFDVFLSADEERPRLLEQAGFGVENSRFTYALGRLVLWSSESLVALSELDSYQYLAIANPRLAPYGLAATEVLTHMGLVDEIQPKLVQGENLAQTFQFVESSAADLGFVALSQVLVLSLEEQGEYQILDQELYEPIRQQALLLTEDATARQFMSFLKSHEIQKLIVEAGYALGE